LLTASARIEESRLQSAIIKANLYPQLNYSASAGWNRGTEAQKIAGGIEGGALNIYGILNWELDIWGKLRHNSRRQ
jgi:multidrug efflux system outer membrane protein